MTTHDPDRTPDQPLPEGLRHALRALRRDNVPERDLWPGIAARIADARTASPSLPPSPRVRRSRRSRRLAGLATAASFAAALAVAWTLLPPSTSPSTSPSPSQHGDAVAGLMLREATRMTHDYQAAWHALDARRRPDADTAALREIERSAAEVRAALRKDPDARFLFERLQSLYARRLDIARRLAT